MQRFATFSVEKFTSESNKVRIGDMFIFKDNDKRILAIISDNGDDYPLFGFLIKEGEQDFTKNRLDFVITRAQEIIRTEYTYNGEQYELEELAKKVCATFILNLDVDLVGTALVKAADLRNKITLPNMGRGGPIKARKLPFQCVNCDLEGLTVRQLKEMKDGIYAEIKGRSNALYIMPTLNFIKKAIRFHRSLGK